MKIVAKLIMALVVLCFIPVSARAVIIDDISFRAAYDGSIDGVIAGGLPNTFVNDLGQPEFRPGMEGQAVYIDGKHSLLMKADGNLPRDNGSIEFRYNIPENSLNKQKIVDIINTQNLKISINMHWSDNPCLTR